MRAGTSNFIIHVGRMEGGSLDLTKQYEFRTLTEVGSSGSGKIGHVENPETAIILVSEALTEIKEFASISAFPTDSLNKIVGVSWYAAVKIMSEITSQSYSTFTDPLKKFLEKLFVVNKVGKVSDSNKNKSAVIAFIHGMLVYAMVHKAPAVPSIDTTLEEKFKWVMKYVESSKGEGKTVAQIQGIWNILQGHYLNKLQEAEIGGILAIFSNNESIDAYLGENPESSRSRSVSIASQTSPVPNSPRVSSSLGR